MHIRKHPHLHFRNPSALWWGQSAEMDKLLLLEKATFSRHCYKKKKFFPRISVGPPPPPLLLLCNIKWKNEPSLCFCFLFLFCFFFFSFVFFFFFLFFFFFFFLYYFFIDGSRSETARPLFDFFCVFDSARLEEKTSQPEWARLPDFPKSRADSGRLPSMFFAFCFCIFFFFF